MFLAFSYMVFSTLAGCKKSNEKRNAEVVFSELANHNFNPLSQDGSMTRDRYSKKDGIADLNDTDWKARLLAVRDLIYAGNGIVQHFSVRKSLLLRLSFQLKQKTKEMIKGLIAGITLLITGYGCYAQSDQVNHVNSEQFQKIIKNEIKGTLLDVRTESEFLNGHLPDAGQLNFYAFDFNKKLLLLSKNQPVYLYCNTGWRSKKAAETLVKNGYTKVYNLEEGIMEWELLNLPVVVEPNARPETKDKMEWDEFNALVESGKPVFIDFYAPWCAPCRQMMPMIDDLKTEYAGKISVVKINADASKRLVKKLALGTVPYFVLFNKGQQTFSHKGLIERDRLENLFSEYL